MVDADDNDKGLKAGFSTLTGLQRLVGIPECAERRKDKGDFPISIDTIVFDFDGTLTDMWAGARPFIIGYKEDLKAVLRERVSAEDMDMIWNKVGANLFSFPEQVVWAYEGRVVSSAVGDPYLECNAIAAQIFDWLGMLKDHKERSGVLQKLYNNNYPKADTVFRDDTPEVLSLAMHFNVCIATNSLTDDVKEKLKQLERQEQLQGGSNGKVHVDYSTIPLFGNARKYEIDDGWQGVPEQMQVKELQRPILLRRKSYFDVLERIRSTYATSFEKMFVIGDNYELDLALPQALGMAIGYVEQPRRLAYEMKAVQRYEKGYVM